MKNESMIETAYKLIEANDGPIAFKDLWEKIKTELEIGPDEEAARIGHFYTDISLDGRFVQAGDYSWNLRSRTSYEKSRVDMAGVYSEINETEKDEADVADDAAYDASVQGYVAGDGEPLSDDEEEGTRKGETAEDLGIKGLA